MHIQQMFAFPVACLTFAVLGLALGLHTRQEGKFAGLALGIGVIIVYMGLHAQAEDWAKGGDFPAVWARWLPNLVLAAGRRRRRSGGAAARSGRDITFSLPALLAPASQRQRRPAPDGPPKRVVRRDPAAACSRSRDRGCSTSTC